MKKGLLCVLAVTVLSGCSLKQMAYNSVADMLAPSPSAKSAKTPAQKGTAAESANPMTALTGENDPILVRDFFPTALKLYEIMHLQNPKHAGLALMTGQLYIMYANAFIQTPAEQLPGDKFDEQNLAYGRAQNFYMRGKDFVLDSLEISYPAFKTELFSEDPARIKALLDACKVKDTAALYWAGAGTLGAFALSPMDSKFLKILDGSVKMLERAAELDPSFNNGSIWEVLLSFYAVAPESLGGGKEKGLDAYEKALQYSEGKSPGTYIAYARSFCIPGQDSAGFDSAIEKALAIDPESQSENRLILTIAHQQAQWLKDHKSDFILE